MAGTSFRLASVSCLAVITSVVVLLLLVQLKFNSIRPTSRTASRPRPKQQPGARRKDYEISVGQFNSSHNTALLREDLEKQDARQHEDCSCPGAKPVAVALQRLSKQSLTVRDHAYNRWKQRQVLRPDPPLALCPGDSPLQYLAFGTEIEPMKSVTLVGLAVSSSAIKSLSYGTDEVKLIFTSRRELGKLSLSCDVKSVFAEGQHTNQMILSLSGEHKSSLNVALKCVVYQSTVAYVFDEFETVSVSFWGSIFDIHIRIRRRPLPFLYQTSSVSPPIHERVTLITKSFERYKELNRLIDSAAKLYPNVKILVADDSVHFQTVDRPNVVQYRMPAQAGWFAGRNLVVSQVMTEYLVWVDDDCVLNENSKLEVSMEMLDKPELGLDLVAGNLGKKTGCGTILDIDRGREGFCLRYRRGDHKPVEGYPHCLHSDRTPNFFMARTRSVQRIGFDPQYNHIGHIEFFIDGYDSLKSVCCTDRYVDHIRGGSAFYNKNRMGGGLMEKRDNYNLFKYNGKQQCWYN